MKRWMILGTLLFTVMVVAEPAWSQQRTRTRNVAGQRGTVTTQRTQQTTGSGGFTRSGTYEAVGNNGETRSGSFSGNGIVEKTEQGRSSQYQGQITTESGSTYFVDRTQERSGNRETGFQQNHSTTVTNADNEVVRSVSGTNVYDGSGQLTQTGTVTNREGETRSYETQIQRLEEGLATKTKAVSNGETTGTTQTQLQYERTPEGGWRLVETGSRSDGTPIQRTLTQTTSN